MQTAVLNEERMTYRFKATFQSTIEAGSASQVAFPANSIFDFTSKRLSMVEGTIHGFPFRAALIPTAAGLALTFSKALCAAAGVSSGDIFMIEITRFDEEPEIRVPADLYAELSASPQAMAIWKEITPMARREWVRWVASAKQEETRSRRIENGIDMLAKGKRRPCCFPGLNWVTKDHVAPNETWVPLPKAAVTV